MDGDAASGNLRKGAEACSEARVSLGRLRKRAQAMVLAKRAPRITGPGRSRLTNTELGDARGEQALRATPSEDLLIGNAFLRSARYLAYGLLRGLDARQEVVHRRYEAADALVARNFDAEC